MENCDDKNEPQLCNSYKINLIKVLNNKCKLPKTKAILCYTIYITFKSNTICNNCIHDKLAHSHV